MANVFPLIILFLHGVFAPDPCGRYKTCTDCITGSVTKNVCVWCAMDDLHGNACKSYDPHSVYSWCPKLLQNPHSTIRITKSRSFSSELDKVVQIKPQEYKIQLRVGEPITYEFSYKAAKDYPVDLYFLLDVSHTMHSMKETIKSRSDEIYRTMRSLTRDVYLGLGNFIDKNAIPFASLGNSTTTFSFRNRLKLTNNTEEFKKAAKNTLFGFNYDTLEGGLDALAQVLACDNRIGWRKQSRKIVMFLTDEESHYAGDGLAAGIFQPYDGRCYTDSNGVYTKELDMDYPSVGMINKLAAKLEATIIFAVTKNKKNIYEEISKTIRGSRCISIKENEIATTLKEIYEEITSSIKLISSVRPDLKNSFKITFDPNCTSSENKNEDCSVKTNEVKLISGSVTLLEYNGVNNLPIHIMIEGINERLTLNVEVITKCDCEDIQQLNSSKCTDTGTYECGLCKCNENRYGNRCQCAKFENSLSVINDNSTCIAKGDTEICTGRGSCVCGSCICSNIGAKKYTGTYCECDSDSCLRNNNAVCSSHGECNCGICNCYDGWTGEACECSTTTDKCKHNDRMCNNRGFCICGSCTCPPRPKWDAREQQDEFCNPLPCPDCHEPQCNRLKDCALCLHQEGNNCPECDTIPNNLTDELLATDDTKWICPDIRVDIGCYTRYAYKYKDDIDSIELVVQKKLNCMESYYIIGGTCLCTLILAGIATLVAWKLLTDARDRREYENFIKLNRERMSSIRKNPLYNDPTTTSENPTYGK